MTSTRKLWAYSKRGDGWYIVRWLTGPATNHEGSIPRLVKIQQAQVW